MSRQKTVLLAALLAVLAAAGFYALSSGTGSQPSAPEPLSADAGMSVAEMPAAEESVAEIAEAPPESEAAAEVAAETTDTVAIDVAAALAERSLGSADAPVTIHEYASLSCNHCAAFSKNVFGQIEEAYINTGKVRFLYTDFPLNAPALDAAMIARCLPADNYFKFLKFLFDKQEEWAFSQTYKDSLRQYAKLVGASDELVDSCLANEELKTGVLEMMKKAQEAHGIQSTPSFIVNGTEVMRGETGFEAFSQKIDALLAESPKAE